MKNRIIIPSGGVQTLLAPFRHLLMHNALWALVAVAGLGAALSSTAAAQVWQASTDYAGTQGYRNWYYLHWNGSTYLPMVYGTNPFGWPNSWYYPTAGDSTIAYGTMHPGWSGRSSRAWESPINGTVRVTGNAHKADLGGGDGVFVDILKNSEVLWSATIAYYDAVGFDFDLTVPVSIGDRIYFRVHIRSTGYYDATYFDPTISELLPDADSDGLPDSEEAVFGTNPADPDSDDDGLLDGTEADMAAGGGCPNPLDSDSDGDTLLDGDEVMSSGTSPCSGDTDGDGLADNLDPTPLVPGAPSSWVEQRLRDDAAAVLAMDLALFDAPNANAAAGRRSALSTGFTVAANHVDQASRSDAVSQLWTLSIRVDGDAYAPDWLLPGAERDALLSEIYAMINSILLLP